MPDDPHDPAEEPEQVAGEELPPAQEDRIVTKVTTALKEFVQTLVGGEGAGEVGEGDGDGSTETPSEPTSPRQIEADIEARVREAMGSLEAEKEHAEHHKHLKEAEKPPMAVSRVTKALWGSPE